MFDTADYSYILPTHRATIYFIGVVLAWYLRSPNKISFSKVSILDCSFLLSPYVLQENKFEHLKELVITIPEIAHYPIFFEHAFG